jgi:hypothetical protein
VTDEPPLPEKPRAETLEETYQRLSPYGSHPDGVPRPPEPPTQLVGSAAAADAEPVDQGAPPPPPRVPKAPRTRRAARAARTATVPRAPANATAKVVIVVAIVVSFCSVLVLGLAGFALVSSVNASRTNDEQIETVGPDPDPAVVDEWTTYPGNAYNDSDDVLAAPSMEKVVEQSRAFVEEYKTALTTEFGIDWDEKYEEYLEQGSNNYGGDSLLYDYNSPEWQGSVVLDDPGARERISDIFSDLAVKYGASDDWLSNELYDDDADASKSQFGAEYLRDQPLWTSYAVEAISDETSFSTRVFDTNLTRDPSFEGDIWFELGEVPSGSLVVTISAASYALLADADRDEFIDRLGDYDEARKPAGR